MAIFRGTGFQPVTAAEYRKHGLKTHATKDGRTRRRSLQMESDQPPKLDYQGPSPKRARPLTQTPGWMRWMDLAQIVLLCIAALIAILGIFL
jgi:hypothetical protein